MKKKASSTSKVLEQSLTLPKNFKFTDEFKNAFNLLEQTNNNFYITGNAGTGKSTLLQYFRQNSKKKIVTLAPTGVAAINIGGSTIHSFFRFPPRLLTNNDVKKIKSKAKLFKAMDTLIIDEISMVRADILDAIDYSLRINCNKPNLPFGGIQIILIGDLYQLPPVVENDIAEYFSSIYSTPFFFSAKIFNELSLGMIELKHVFRQDDDKFISLLNKIRNNNISEHDITNINNKCNKPLKLKKNDIAITLTGTNLLASTINHEKLSTLQEREYIFESNVDGDFDEKSYPTDKLLKLKKGAQVMMVKNDPEKRWVNGTLGIIHEITQKSIKIEIDQNIYDVERCNWEKIEYEFDNTTGNIDSVVIGEFNQYPIKLAWAITIHKSQGKTFDKVIIDLGRGAFAHGQTYVALSRCRTLEGIHLKTPIKQKDIILDPRVVDFHKYQATAC